jgi:hypothetical protein
MHRYELCTRYYGLLIEIFQIPKASQSQPQIKFEKKINY